MKITGFPTTYQSAYDDAIFTFSALSTEVLDVDIFAHNGVTVVGKKRFSGATSHSLNVANYVQPQFSIIPQWSGNPNFYKPLGRYVNVSIRCGAVASSSVLSAAGGRRINYLQKLSASPDWRRITPFQRDEIAMITDETPMYATVTLKKGSQTVTHRLPNKPAEEGPTMLFVNMNTLATAIRNAGYGELASYETMCVEIKSDDELFLTQNYVIEAEQPDQVRLCWLNSYGQIDYYTMKRTLKRTLRVDKKRIYTPLGYRVIGSDVETVEEIVSNFEPEATMNWLAELIASPMVWIDNKKVFVPIDVLTGSVVRSTDDLCQLQLAYRTPLNTRYQHN